MYYSNDFNSKQKVIKTQTLKVTFWLDSKHIVRKNIGEEMKFAKFEKKIVVAKSIYD